MVAYEITFEGSTEGAQVSDGFSSVVAPTGSTFNTVAAAAMHGTRGARLTTTSPSIAVYGQADIAAADRYVMRFYHNTPATIPNVSGTVIAQFRTAAGTAASLAYNSSGRLQLYNATGSGVSGGAASASPAVSTRYRIEFGINGVTGAGDLAYYLGESTTPVQSLSVTGQSFGAAQLTRFRLGRAAGTTWLGTLDYDSVRVEDKATGFIGVHNTDAVSAGADQVDVEPWSTVTLTATSSGTVAWSRVSGPNPVLSGTGLTRTFIAPPSFTAQTSVFRATTGTATDDVSVTYLPATDGICTSINPVVVTPVRLIRKV